MTWGNDMDYRIQTGSKMIVAQIKDEMDQETNSDYQYLEVEYCDAGAGPYFRIKTEGWAISNLQELEAMLNDMMGRFLG